MDMTPPAAMTRSLSDDWAMARSVLVVEDKPTVRETLAKALAEDGLRETAGDGAEALECFRTDRPDVDVLDTTSKQLTSTKAHFEPCRGLSDVQRARGC